MNPAAPGLLQQILARNPRRLARFPEVPIEQALIEWRQLQAPPAAAAPMAPVTPAPLPAGPTSEPALAEFLGSLATHVWRAKNKMVDSATGEPREDAKRTYRHIEAAIETLRQMEVTVNDWLNQAYDAGLPVKVLAFQPTPGLVRDTIVEVMRPAVIWKERLLQSGEVIVGIPLAPDAAPSLKP